MNDETGGPGNPFTIGILAATVEETDHRTVRPSIGFRLEQSSKVELAGNNVPSAGVDEMCRNADPDVHTVIRDDLVSTLVDALPSGKRMRDILDYRSSVEQTAQTATRAGVKNLVLTHYVPPMAPGQESDWKAQATAQFAGR